MKASTAEVERFSRKQDRGITLVALSSICAAASLLAGAFMMYTFVLFDGGLTLSLTALLQFVWSFLSVPAFVAATRRAFRRGDGWAVGLLAVGTVLFVIQAIGAVLVAIVIGLQCSDGGSGGPCDATGPSGLAVLAYVACAVLGVIALIVAVIIRLRRRGTIGPEATQETMGTQQP